MAAGERIRYRKLPGKRRGFLKGSSVWLGPDHLLLVRSNRFREEYKRFHMRDIQAIAIASAPRFHVSTRSFVMGCLWLIVFSIVSTRWNWTTLPMVLVSLGLVALWGYVSMSHSCVCRIYTAVSCDDLPSLYRTWTARRFMQRVEPYILAAQGEMDGDRETEWMEALEAKRIGPAEQAPPALPITGEGISPAEAGARTGRAWPIAEVYVALMFVDALVTYWTERVTGREASSLWWVGYSTLGLELVFAIALLIQYSRRTIVPGMRKLVIASLLVTGLIWYAQPMITAFSVAANPGHAADYSSLRAMPMSTGLHWIDIGAHVIWGIVGIGILIAARQKRFGGGS